MELLNLLSSLLLFTPLALADGLYGKNSAVLQVDARSYSKLIEKSNHTSIVEFYAPWCGHCKNLKPGYEKAAKALAGHAKVAAVNCDEDSNKAFCGSMGVQGFPTLKIVRPKKKGGKPSVSDYRGAREADAIIETMEDKIPNHVTKLTDATLDDWLAKGDKPKAVFFSEKGALSPLIKGIAIDFLGAMEVAQIKSTEKAAMNRFMVESVPKVFFLTTGEHVPEQHQGKMTKSALVEFFSGTGLVTPNPDYIPSSGKASKAKSSEKKKKDTGPGKPTKIPKAASETPQDQGPPIESPDPKVNTKTPADLPPTEEERLVQVLHTEDELRKLCLTIKSTTCVLAVISETAAKEDNEIIGLKFLTEVEYTARKYKGRKMFPFYAISSANSYSAGLLNDLGVKVTNELATVVAINAKRGWWTSYDGPLEGAPLEAWIDSIKLGGFKKQKLSGVKLSDVEEPFVVKEPPSAWEMAEETLPRQAEESVDKDHDEL